MTEQEAWDKLIKHCRWMGIPVKHGKSKVFLLYNGKPIQVLAQTKQFTNWEQNFRGAWKITLHIPSEGPVSWNMVALLVHEIGHVLDFRENMLILNRSILDDERSANKHGIKTAKILNIPVKKIQPFLRKLIKTYKECEVG